MSVFQFIAAMLIPVVITVYAFNFSLWLWKGGNHMGGVGGFLLTLLSGGGALGYFAFKLLV